MKCMRAEITFIKDLHLKFRQSIRKGQLCRIRVYISSRCTYKFYFRNVRLILSHVDVGLNNAKGHFICV